MRKIKQSVVPIAMFCSLIFCGMAESAGKEVLPAMYSLLFSRHLQMVSGPSISNITGATVKVSATINKDGTGYYLVRLATEPIPSVDEILASTLSFPMTGNVVATATITGLSPYTIYWLDFMAQDTSHKTLDTVLSVAFTTTSAGYVPVLNDTGMHWGGNYPSGNNSTCTGEEIGAQDCSHGRDVTHPTNPDGHAGFSFTKLDANGNPLVNQTASYVTEPWSCLRDNVTGLTWEVKTNDGGLHDFHDGFSWYNSDSATNGGDPGYNNQSNNCEGHVVDQPATYCNTEDFAARVNAAGFCGATDWRMPTRKELLSIVSYDRQHPAIDTSYFPNTSDGVLWTATIGGWHTYDAWYVHMVNGESSFTYRYNVYPIMLVRGVPDL